MTQSSNGPLGGKSALVTGASSGIGLAVARLLAKDGAAVVLMGRRADALASARDGLLAEIPGARIEVCAGSATNEEDVKAALRQTHALTGTVDILIPTVGGSDNYYPLLMETKEHFMKVLELNMLSAFLIVRHGAPLMQPNGGSIVCISTTTVNQPCTGVASYVAAKAGLERFVTIAAVELGGAKIRVNSVRPGLTRSATTEFMIAVPGVEGQFAERTPLGRIGEAEDVAKAVRFLAGPESDWVTGQNIAADGGQALAGATPDFLEVAYGKEMMDKIRAGRPPEG